LLLYREWFEEAEKDMGLVKVTLSATTTGTTGSASASVTSSVFASGLVHAVYLSVPSGGTANVSLAAAGDPSENIVQFGTVTASEWRYPRRQVCNYTGTAGTYDGVYPVQDRYVVSDYLSMSVSEATTAKTFSMTVFIQE
jgi:hypothetical protein